MRENSMKRALLILGLLIVGIHAPAAWALKCPEGAIVAKNTGTFQSWNNAYTWEGGVVPTANDDVCIDKGKVRVDSAVYANTVILTAFNVYSGVAGNLHISAGGVANFAKFENGWGADLVIFGGGQANITDLTVGAKSSVIVEDNACLVTEKATVASTGILFIKDSAKFDTCDLVIQQKAKLINHTDACGDIHVGGYLNVNAGGIITNKRTPYDVVENPGKIVVEDEDRLTVNGSIYGSQEEVFSFDLCEGAEDPLLNCGTVLAVELNNFEANPMHVIAELTWNVAEGTTHVFQIERSANGTAFSPIGEEVEYTGSGIYKAIDPRPMNGTNYYRLMQYDLDGTPTQSNIVVAELELVQPVLYPNPIVGNTAHISDGHAYATFEVRNQMGQLLDHGQLPSDGQMAFNHPAGTYVINLISKDGNTRKALKAMKR